MSPVKEKPEVTPAVGKVFAAIVQVSKKVTAVGKDKRNTDQNFKYRGIDDIYNALHDAMAEAGIFTVPKVLQRKLNERKTSTGKPMLHVEQEQLYTVYHEDGSSVEIGPIWSEGMDMSDKATNKALAVAHKYALMQTFSIPTEDLTDADKETLELGGDAPRRQAQNNGRASQPPRANPPAGKAPPVRAKLSALVNAVKASRWTEDNVKTYVAAAFNVPTVKDLSDPQLEIMTKVIVGTSYEQAIQEFHGPSSEQDEPSPDDFAAQTGTHIGGAA